LPKLACVAGEPSGDLLAAPVLSALNQIPDMSELEVYGIGGPRMQAEGMRSDWPMETLSVRGYVEAIKQLPAILKLRKDLIANLLGEERPDVFLGIDAPDFNLGRATAAQCRNSNSAFGLTFNLGMASRAYKKDCASC
jgi:lipid-A-disaccharide synthase